MEKEIDIETIIEIISGANKIVLDLYDNYNLEKNDINLSYKSDNSPVTEADKKASNFICGELQKNYPDIPIICEETEQVNYNDRKNFEYFWLVDPLDGTKEFLKKNGEFTINIGLIKGTKSILGVVSVPCQNKIYYASKNKGAYVRLNNTTMEIKCRKINHDNPTIICSRSHLNKETSEYLKKYSKHEISSAGSSLKFMMIAEGNADIYPRLNGSMEWDTAASHIITEESGATISTYPDNVPLSYNKESLLNPYFIVYGKE